MAVTALQARALLAAETTWANAKNALDEATRARAKQRARCRGRLTSGELAVAGGVEVLVTETQSGQSFSLKGYLERHKITRAMAPFVGDPTPYDRWTVRRRASDQESKP